MKNLKNMLVVSGLMVVLMIGASTANAGIIIIARADQEAIVQPTDSTQCTETSPSFLGIVLTDLKGLLVSDAPEVEQTGTGCQDADNSYYGLLVSD
jgi:hypothetical protein